MTKQERIAEAYIGATKEELSHLDQDGWMHSKWLNYEALCFEFEHIDHLGFVDVWRPKTLRGIENERL